MSIPPNYPPSAPAPNTRYRICCPHVSQSHQSTPNCLLARLRGRICRRCKTVSEEKSRDKLTRRANQLRFAESSCQAKSLRKSKIFRFYRSSDGDITTAIPSYPVGASAVVTTRGGLRWTLEAATDARGQGVRQRRVVLTPQMLASTVATVHGSPGRAR